VIVDSDRTVVFPMMTAPTAVVNNQVVMMTDNTTKDKDKTEDLMVEEVTVMEEVMEEEEITTKKSHVLIGKTMENVPMVTNAVSNTEMVVKIKLITTNKKITETEDSVEEEEAVIMTVETTTITIEVEMVVDTNKELEVPAINLKKKVNALMVKDVDSSMVKKITGKKDQEEFALNSKKVNAPMVINADLLMKNQQNKMLKIMNNYQKTMRKNH
jgi:hypothetical protein